MRQCLLLQGLDDINAVAIRKIEIQDSAIEVFIVDMLQTFFDGTAFGDQIRSVLEQDFQVIEK